MGEARIRETLRNARFQPRDRLDDLRRPQHMRIALLGHPAPPSRGPCYRGRANVSPFQPKNSFRGPRRSARAPRPHRGAAAEKRAVRRSSLDVTMPRIFGCTRPVSSDAEKAPNDVRQFVERAGDGVRAEGLHRIWRVAVGEEHDRHTRCACGGDIGGAVADHDRAGS